MKKKSIFTIVFIIIFCVVIVLFALKIINKKNTRYYQYYVEFGKDGIFTQYNSREIELNSDMTARWRFAGTSSGGDYYKGIYTETSSKIVLTLERDMPNDTVCDDSNSLFPCKTVLTLSKLSNDTVKSIDELGNDGLSYEYKLVQKDKLHYIK